MAQTPHQIPSPTNQHNLSDTTNYPLRNELQPTPLDSPNSQHKNNFLQRFHIIDELQVCPARTNEQQDITSQPVPEDDQEFFKQNRGWLMVVAILAAGSTYQAGLSPPGTFWQDDNGNVAGDPILSDKHFDRYQAFFYCNAISFVSSLVIIILLMNNHFYSDSKRIKALRITMVLDLLSFMTAYAVGSCRRVKSSIYLFLIMGVVAAYVVMFAIYYSVLRRLAYRARLCMRMREALPVRPEV